MEPLTILYRRQIPFKQLQLLLDRIYCSEKLMFSIVFFVNIVIRKRDEIMKITGDEIMILNTSFFKFTDDEFEMFLHQTDDLYCQCESNGYLQELIQ